MSKWPGFHADGEPEHMRQEQQREREIQAENLSARIRAASQPGAVDPATGRTFADAVARGMYDDASRIRDYRETCDHARRTREGLRWAQARIAGRRGRN